MNAEHLRWHGGCREPAWGGMGRGGDLSRNVETDLTMNLPIHRMAIAISSQLDLTGGRPYDHHCACSCTQGWPRIQVSTVLLDIDIFIIIITFVIIIIIAVIDHYNRPHRNQAGLHGQRGAELFLRRPRYAWGHQVLAGTNICFHDFKILAISWGQSPIIMPTSCFHSKYLSSTDKTWPRGFLTALRVTRTTTRMSPFSRNSKIRWQSQEGQHHGLWQQRNNNKTLKI